MTTAPASIAALRAIMVDISTATLKVMLAGLIRHGHDDTQAIAIATELQARGVRS